MSSDQLQQTRKVEEHGYNLRLQREGSNATSNYLKSKYEDFEIIRSPRRIARIPGPNESLISSPRSKTRQYNEDILPLAQPQDLFEGRNTLKSDVGSPSVGPTRASSTIVNVHSVRNSDNEQSSKYSYSNSAKQIDGAGDVILSERSSDPSSLTSRSGYVNEKMDLATFRQMQKDSLNRLNNLLKLPQARRWVWAEFFYSDVDRELFFGDNEFRQCLREHFPTLRTRMLNKIQWRTVRKLIGKPRRCSYAFLAEERVSLNSKRQLIRDLYKGLIGSIDDAEFELPEQIPQCLTVGDAVFAVVHKPREGMFQGTVDAVVGDHYRIVFEKNVVPPLVVADINVMSVNPVEKAPVSYFLKRNKSLRAGFKTFASTHRMEAGVSTGSSVIPGWDDNITSNLINLGASTSTYSPIIIDANLNAPAGGHSFDVDHNLGPFPSKLIFAVVRLNKLIKLKRKAVQQIEEMNCEAERVSIFTDAYPETFQAQYAEVLIHLEKTNEQIKDQLNVLSENYGNLLPQLSDVSISAHPETVPKLSRPYAASIVKHCNDKAGLACVNSKRLLECIMAFTSLLLQIKSLGQSKSMPESGVGTAELNALWTTVMEIKQSLAPENVRLFEERVEVHLDHIEQNCVNLNSNCC